MGTFILTFFLFNFVLFASIYWHLWYKLGPSIVKDIFKRLVERKEKIGKVDPEIRKFLKKMNYPHFYVIESSLGYGMAHPFSKEVVISSKICETKNLNLIKYVLAHEIAHKRQGNTKIGVIYFSFGIVSFLTIYCFFRPPLWITVFWALILGIIASYGQRKFEDLADLEVARILGKENVIRAIRDLFILNGKPLIKRTVLKDKPIFSRDFSGRVKIIKNFRSQKNWTQKSRS